MEGNDCTPNRSCNYALSILSKVLILKLIRLLLMLCQQLCQRIPMGQKPGVSQSEFFKKKSDDREILLHNIDYALCILDKNLMIRLTNTK